MSPSRSIRTKEWTVVSSPLLIPICTLLQLAALVTASATAPLGPSTTTDPQHFLHSHNVARAQVNVTALRWDATLAAYALSWGQHQRDYFDCDLQHSRGPYGENLFWGSSTDFTAAEAVDSWVSEREFYNYQNNSCSPGEVCGHYTQVVWRRSTLVGCAAVNCNDGSIFMGCNYKPRGNVVGARPYDSLL